MFELSHSVLFTWLSLKVAKSNFTLLEIIKREETKKKAEKEIYRLMSNLSQLCRLINGLIRMDSWYNSKLSSIFARFYGSIKFVLLRKKLNQNKTRLRKAFIVVLYNKSRFNLIN